MFESACAGHGLNTCFFTLLVRDEHPDDILEHGGFKVAPKLMAQGGPLVMQRHIGAFGQQPEWVAMCLFVVDSG